MKIYKPKKNLTYDEKEEREEAMSGAFFIRGCFGYVRPVTKRIQANEYPGDIVFFEKRGDDPANYSLIVRFEGMRPYWTMCGEKAYKKYKKPILKWMAMWNGEEWLKKYKEHEKEQKAREKARRKEASDERA